MNLYRGPLHKILISALSVSLFTICIIPSTASSQSASDPVLLSGRLTLGLNPVRTSAPPENTQMIKYGFQVYLNGPRQSKLLIESSYSFWQAGDTFRGQVGGLPQWPPAQTKGNSIAITSGLRITEWSIGPGVLTPIACLTLSFQTERWAFLGYPWGKDKHSEWQIVSEIRLHIKVSSRRMAPILELGGQWSHTLKELDDRESLMNRRSVFGALLIPVLLIDDDQ